MSQYKKFYDFNILVIFLAEMVKVIAGAFYVVLYKLIKKFLMLTLYVNLIQN